MVNNKEITYVSGGWNRGKNHYVTTMGVTGRGDGGMVPLLF